MKLRLSTRLVAALAASAAVAACDTDGSLDVASATPQTVVAAPFVQQLEVPSIEDGDYLIHESYTPPVGKICQGADIQRMSDAISFYISACAHVRGDLVISDTALSAVDFLRQVETVEGDLRIERNPELGSLDGLEGLTTVGGDVAIVGNQDLADLHGLAGMGTVGGDVIVEYNNRLESIEGLAGLYKAHGVSIVRNQSLVSLDGLEGLERLAGDLAIGGAGVLDDLQALDGLKYVSGDLVLHDFGPGADQRSWLPELIAVGGTVQIAFQRYATEMSLLRSLRYAGGLHIVMNDALTTLPRFPRLGTLGGDFVVTVNGKLGDLNGIKGLQTVQGAVVVVNNPSLTDASALTSIQTVVGDMTVDLPGDMLAGPVRPVAAVSLPVQRQARSDRSAPDAVQR